MVVLDTSFLVDMLRGDAPKEIVESVRHQSYVSTISAMELIFGTMKSERNAEQEDIILFLNSFTMLEFDLESAKEAAKIKHKLFKEGSLIETEDIMIAAIAKANNQSIVTRNSKHFNRIEGLKVLGY